MDIILTTKLALVDSINPCTLAVQAALLATLLTKDRKNALIGGILFCLTIYFMYLLYGLALHTILLLFYNIIKYLLMALLILMIFLEFKAYFFYKPGLISIEMPMKLRPLAKKFLSYAQSPLISIPIAVLLSLFLLPCSSGPYIIFLGLQKQINWPLLFYYLFIFILPMIIITLLVYFGTKPEKIKEWRDKHVRELHLISGLLLLGVLIYLII